MCVCVCARGRGKRFLSAFKVSSLPSTKRTVVSRNPRGRVPPLRFPSTTPQVLSSDCLNPPERREGTRVPTGHQSLSVGTPVGGEMCGDE